MNTQSSQPRAIYYVVALQIWEYFSFYGMRALLILYLTNQLKYDDNHAYALFSAYCSLVYVTPILGGFLADKLLGNRMAVMLGALLMAIGHLVLGASEIAPIFLYLSLAIIVCGYGLFKSNVSCLLGELYEPTDPRRDGGFSLMYAAGNVGSIIAPIACGYVQEEYSWAMGFALAAVGMIAGLVIFLSGNRHFRHTRGVNREALRARSFVLPNWGWLLVLLIAAPLLITVLFWQEWSVYALIVATVIGLAVLTRIYLRAETAGQHKDLRLIMVLTCFSLLFWAFAQQGGSSISLYIDRFVNRHFMGYEIPTAMFQSVNAFAVMLCGVVLAWLVKENINGNRTVRIWGKFALGLGLMSAGFLHPDPQRPLVSRLWPLLDAADGIRSGGDGLCRTIYRPGSDVANHPHSDPRRDRRADRHLYAALRRYRQLSGGGDCRPDLAGVVRRRRGHQLLD